MKSLYWRYTDLLEGWIDRFLDAEKQIEAQNYFDLCDRFHQSLFLTHCSPTPRRVQHLDWNHMSRLPHGLPQNRHSRDLQASWRVVCHRFGCDPAQAQRLAWAFLAASGAQQRAIDLGDDAEIPETLQKLAKTMSFRDVFLNMVLPLALACLNNTRRTGWPAPYAGLPSIKFTYRFVPGVLV